MVPPVPNIDYTQLDTLRILLVELHFRFRTVGFSRRQS